MKKLLALVMIAGCAAPPPPEPVPVAAPPEAWKPAVDRANRALQSLQSELAQKLIAEVVRAGPEGAIDVCRTEAAAITARVAREQGLEIGRTSLKLRNPANAPRPWLGRVLEEARDATGAEAGARVFDLGPRIGIARPIIVGTLCLKCHGDALEAGVAAKLKSAYPADAATGYQEGDLRGFAWVEVSKP
jgi:hypothetical protein